MCFDGVYKITQVEVGAVPTGSPAEDSDRDVVIHIFAKDLLKGGSSRFQCMYEGLRQPSNGTIVVPMQGMVTNHIVLRGMYQTVPVTIYGFKLDSIADMRQDKDSQEEAEYYVEPSRERFVAGVFLTEEHVDALRVIGDDTSSVEDIRLVVERLGDMAYTIWQYSTETLDSHDIDPLLKSAVNRAVSWISAFLSTLDEGFPCKKYEIDMAGYGLDILAISFLHATLASDFVVQGGGLILRAILSMRGLPGSFYNKALALIAVLMRQANVDACRMLMKETFSKCKLLSGDAIFSSRDSLLQQGNAKRSRQGGNAGRKQSRKKAKLENSSSHSEKAVSSIEKFLDEIDAQDYAQREIDFWRMQGDSRDTIADALEGHSTRFKPRVTRDYHILINSALEVYKSCKLMLKALRDLSAAYPSSSKATLLDIGADLVDAVDILTSQIEGTKIYRSSCAGKEIDVQEDTSSAGKCQIFSSFLEHYRISEEVQKTVERISEHLIAPKLEYYDTCEKVCGIVSVVVVNFFSCLLNNRELLSSSSVQHLMKILASDVFASDHNPHKCSFNSLRFQMDYEARIGKYLARLVSADWSTLETFSGQIFMVSDASPTFLHHINHLTEKCIKVIDIYRKGAVGNDLVDVKLIKSFEVARNVLLEIMLASHPGAQKVLLSHSAKAYEAIDTLINSNVLMESVLPHSQRIRGGLLALTQSATNGLTALLGIVNAQLPLITIKDNNEVFMDLNEYFDTLDAVCFGKSLSVTMSWDEIRLLLDDPDRLGQVIASMQFLRSCLENAENTSMVSQRVAAISLPLRALVCATEILSASLADNMWMHRIGTTMNTGDISSNRSIAIVLMESITAFVCSFIQKISKSASTEKVDNLPLLCSLLKAHACVSLENQAMMDIALKDYNNSHSSLMRKIRWNLIKTLRCWIDSPRMSPKVIPTALSGSSSAPIENGCAVSFSPASFLSISMLLGDLFPSEWPKPGYKNHLLSEEKKYRAALTEEIESCIESFEHFVASCMVSETLYLHSSAIRFLSKGAGLGGGMGSFLMGIVSTQFGKIVSLPVLTSYALYDIRKILEIMVPMIYQPANKAAALDTTVPLHLAQLVEKIIQQISNPDSTCDREEVSSILTMTFECLIVLSDPSIRLDIFETRTSAAEDILGKEAGSLISCIILDHIAVLGPNIPLAINLLQIMSQYKTGRNNILLGVVQLCMKSQGEQIEYPTIEQVVAATQWLVYQYKTIQSQSQDEAVTFVFNSLENILIEASVVNHSESGMSEDQKRRSAPSRFAAVAKEASTRGSTRGFKSRYNKGNHLDLIQDCESAVIFWRNQDLRHIHGSAAAAHAARLSKYIGWDIGQEMDKFCMADILHPWMTHPGRPLNEKMNAEQLDDDSQHEGFMQSEVAQEQQIEETGGLQEPIKDEVKDQSMTEAPKVDLASLSEVLKTNTEGIALAAEEDEEIDLYADLYPSMDLPKIEEPETQIKSEEEMVQETMEETAPVQINFDEEDDNEDSSASDQEEKEDKQEEDDPDAPATNEDHLEEETDRAYSQDDLKDLLKDRKKVEELLASNPALLAQLKERLGQK